MKKVPFNRENTNKKNIRNAWSLNVTSTVIAMAEANARAQANDNGIRIYNI